ncbi:MAG: TonB-dependent receptor plug domain-containing protein [Chromatocurvus sp.]
MITSLHPRLLAVAATVTATWSPAFAQTSPTLETVLVTGSRLENAGSTVEVLTQADIQQVNAISTTQLLRQLRHVIVSQNGGLGGQSFISIRGGEPNFTLVLIDGVAVNDPTNSRGGGFDFNQIDPSALERVEVYRGGISAIHGGEAISGVIHLITRAGDGSSVSVSAGNKGQRIGNLTLSKQLTPSITALVNAGYTEQSRSAFSAYENRQLLAKVTHTGERSTSSLLVSASDQSVTAFAEDSGGNQLASPRIAETRDSEQWVAALNTEFVAHERVTLAGRLSFSEHEELADNPGIADGTTSGIPASEIRSTFSRLEAEVVARVDLGTHWEGLAGLNFRDLEGSNEGFLDFGFPVPAGFRLDQSVAAAFAELRGHWSSWQLSLGARVDDPDQFERETSSRLSASYRPGNSWTAYASYSEGYKLPSFFALAHPLVGNPDLQPERSENAEAGLRFHGSDALSVEATWFRNDFSDLVDFDNALFTNVNRSSVRAEGAEVSADIQVIDWLSLRADAMYLSTDIRNSTDQLRRRPRWSGALHLRAALTGFTANLSLDSRGSFIDSSVPTGPIQLDGFTTVNAAATWHLGGRLALNAAVDNLLDKQNEEAVGFTDTGRQWRVGLRYSL